MTDTKKIYFTERHLSPECTRECADTFIFALNMRLKQARIPIAVIYGDTPEDSLEEHALSFEEIATKLYSRKAVWCSHAVKNKDQ